MKLTAPRWALPILAALALVFPLLVAADARAGGSIAPSKTELTESNGGWKLFLTVKLGKKPANPTQTFRFIFTPTNIYETFLDDAHGDQEQTRNVPQGKDADPVRASLDVSFSDMKGQVWDTTKFDFTIRRENGVFAGEYNVEVRDSDNNVVGRAFKVKLAGKNDVVDRRAIVMADTSKKKKKEAPKEEPKDNAAASDAPAGDKPAAESGDAKPEGEGDGAAPPPPVEKKAGGCGCEVPVSPGEQPWAPSGLAALGLLAIAARRRR